MPTSPPVVAMISVDSIDDWADRLSEIWPATDVPTLADFLKHDDVSECLDLDRRGQLAVLVDSESTEKRVVWLAVHPLYDGGERGMVRTNPPDDAAEASQRGRLVVIKSIDHANQVLKTIANQLYFWVDRYEHSSVDLSLTGGSSQNQFDTSVASAVYVPDDHLQLRFKHYRKTESWLEARAHCLDDAKKMLNYESDYINGYLNEIECCVFDETGHLIEHEWREESDANDLDAVQQSWCEEIFNKQRLAWDQARQASALKLSLDDQTDRLNVGRPKIHPG